MLACQRFVAPAAPPVAAEMEGTEVDRRLLRTGAAWWSERVDFLVVEGAGGLLSPIARDESVAELARDLGFPVLIVARLGLGTINHTLLTLEAARARGLAVAGVIINDAQNAAATDVSCRRNPAELARLGAAPILAITPWCEAADLLPALQSQKLDRTLF